MFTKKWKGSIRLFIKVSFMIFLIVMLGFNGQKAYSIGKNTKSVLVLNSYSRDYAWTSEIVEGIKEQVKSSYSNYNLNIEYMDLKGYSNEHTVSSIKDKYNSMDLVITTDYDSLEFMINNRQNVFGKEVPIVFTGVSNKAYEDLINGHENITGVIEHLNIKGTLEQAFNIRPDTKTLYFIHDETVAGNNSLEEIKEAIKNLNKDIKLIEVKDIEMNSLGNTLKDVSEDSIVLLAQYTKGPSGQKIINDEIMKDLSREIKVPIFVLYDINIMFNGLGGSVLSGGKVGQATTKLASKVLEKGSTEGISIVNGIKSSNIYNYRAMKNYALEEKDIPKGSYVINGDINKYEKYKQTIWKEAAIIGILLILLITMIVNRKRLVKVEKVINRTKQQYKDLFDASNDGMWEYDLKTGKRILSEEWHSNFHADLPDDGSRNINNWFDKVHPEDYPKLKSLMDKTLSGETDKYSFEYRVRNVHGEYIWIASKGKGIKDDQGNTYKVIGSHSNIHLRKVYEEEVHRMAFSDDTTGIANKVAFVNRFEEIIKDGTECTLLNLDLDNFKNINYFFGHSVGDKFLLAIANKLKKYIRPEDMLARYGGDSFLILLNGVVKEKELKSFLENLLNKLEETISVDEFNMVIPASIGVARYPYDGKDFEEVFKNVDTALYKAKEQGRRTYVCFEEWMNSDVMKEVEIEEALRVAIKNNEFYLNFQPKYNIEKSRIDGFEALIRLNSSKLGFVSPIQFINIAEKTGLIIPIGRWILENTCNFIKNLKERGYGEVTIAVNISVIQLMQKDFIDIVKEVIDKSGVNESSVELEITESVLMKSIDNNIPKIQELKDFGLGISIDDFGTGYSSFNYLKDIPGDTLKIDKTFIDQLSASTSKDTKGWKIVGTIIQLAHHMNFKVVAEGVETKEQYDYLKENNCDSIQGYYISKPLGEKDAIEILSKNIPV